MARSQSSETLRRPQSALRILFPIFAVTSLLLGYFGLGQFVTGHEDMGHRPIDLIYYDLQLFVLGADPLQAPGPYPRLLEAARFLAPAVTLYAIVEAARLLFSVEISRIRARRSIGHAIVCGDTGFAQALTRRLQADHIDVVEIRNEVDEFVTTGEPLRIIGDARDPAVLKAAGVAHADTVYACADGSAANVAIALAVGQARTHRCEALSVYSHIPDADLCATFQATFLGRPKPGGVNIDFFNIDHIAARRLFVEYPLLPVRNAAPRLLVAGIEGFGAAIVVEAARLWRIADPLGRHRLPITVVGEPASAVIGALVQRYPFLQRVCEFSIRDVDLLPLLADGLLIEPPDRALICYPDEEYALKTAMTAERFWRGKSDSITVRLDGLAAFLGDRDGAVLGPVSRGNRLLQIDPGSVRAFGVIGAASDPALIREDLLERLAHVIHDHYMLGRRRRGEWSDDDSSLQPWENLSPRLRSANRSAAEDIGRKLASIDCLIIPRFGPDRDVTLADADIEFLARLEHERWCDEYERAGWRYSLQRDEEQKLHPGLMPWNSLPETFRRRSAEPIRELSVILADAGFRIVRV
jgi:hypothetical protein